MIRHLLLILLVACASRKVGVGLPPEHKHATRTLVEQSLEESRKTITNRRNYLLALFEQSADPYYGTPRWSEECLSANKIGKLQEDSNGIYMASHLYLLPTMEPGFCPEIISAEPYYVVLYQCVGTKRLVELTTSAVGLDSQFDWKILCN